MDYCIFLVQTFVFLYIFSSKICIFVYFQYNDFYFCTKICILYIFSTTICIFVQRFVFLYIFSSKICIFVYFWYKHFYFCIFSVQSFVLLYFFSSKSCIFIYFQYRDSACLYIPSPSYPCILRVRNILKHQGANPLGRKGGRGGAQQSINP